MVTYHIAQANWARAIAPIDDPVMADFVELLAPINAIADETPGFVWRLTAEDGETTVTHAFDDPLLIFNMSVWESIDALHHYTYKERHIELIRGRGKWFDPPDRAPLVMWWIPAGTLPTASEARERFEDLWSNGPTERAFTFRDRYEPPA